MGVGFGLAGRAEEEAVAEAVEVDDEGVAEVVCDREIVG